MFIVYTVLVVYERLLLRHEYVDIRLLDLDLKIQTIIHECSQPFRLKNVVSL